MALGTKLVYVTGTDAGDGIKAIGFTPSSASYRSTGDNATTFYAGRVSRAGTIVVEDTTTAETLIAAVAAEKYFDTVTDDDAARVTLAGFMVTGYNTDIGDGMDGGDVPGITLNWVSTGMSVGAVA